MFPGSSQRPTHLCLAPGLLTSSDHLLDLDTGHIDLLGELSDGLVGVLVGEGVNVDFHPRSNYGGRGAGTRGWTSGHRQGVQRQGPALLGELLPASLLSLPHPLCQARVLPLPHENAEEPHELAAQDSSSCLSPSSLITLKRVSLQFLLPLVPSHSPATSRPSVLLQ